MEPMLAVCDANNPKYVATTYSEFEPFQVIDKEALGAGRRRSKKGLTGNWTQDLFQTGKPKGRIMLLDHQALYMIQRKYHFSTEIIYLATCSIMIYNDFSVSLIPQMNTMKLSGENQDPNGRVEPPWAAWPTLRDYVCLSLLEDVLLICGMSFTASRRELFFQHKLK